MVRAAETCMRFLLHYFPLRRRISISYLFILGKQLYHYPKKLLSSSYLNCDCLEGKLSSNKFHIQGQNLDLSSMKETLLFLDIVFQEKMLLNKH
jgi:hypothetical protein